MKNRNVFSRTFAYVLHQIWNEKRSNGALFAELLIVASIVWFLVDSIFVTMTTRLEPTGFDATNCYKVEVGYLTEGSVGYDASIDADSTHSVVDDRLALIDLLRHDEDIEAAAYSLRNDPYNGTSMTNGFKVDTFDVSPRTVICQPDFMRVFRYQGVDGQTPEQLAALLKGNNVFLSYMKSYRHDWHKYLNTDKVLLDSMHFCLAALVPPIKRFTWEEQAGNDVILLPMTNGYFKQTSMINLSIRVKDNKMPGFEERFKAKIKNHKMRAGNMYISGFTSYDTLRHDTESGKDATLRAFSVCIGFLLVNVFLGLLGTFWFRTQHRFPEIGLQKAIGATNRDITLRLFAEAFIIMTVAFVLSLVVDGNIAHAQLTPCYQNHYFTASRFAICAAISYVMMLVIIALGIWFPALRAIRTNPTEVLRGE